MTKWDIWFYRITAVFLLLINCVIMFLSIGWFGIILPMSLVLAFVFWGYPAQEYLNQLNGNYSRIF